MIVAKFGGTSVKDAEAVRRLYNTVSSNDDKTIVVVSALAGVTDNLIKIVEHTKLGNSDKSIELLESILERHLALIENLELTRDSEIFVSTVFEKIRTLIFALSALGETTNKSTDMIVSNGELLSSRIIADYFKTKNPNSIHIDPRKLIKTSSDFGSAEVIFPKTFSAVNSLLSECDANTKYFITGGFVGSDLAGNTTTLGRGGSDYSAAIIAQAVKADKLEIWTDVSGILTTDPRVVPNAKIIKVLSYNEASELSFFGAKVLHPKTIFPAVNAKIPVFVKNSNQPEFEGTKIVAESVCSHIIKSIAFRKNIVVVNIRSDRMLGAYGFLSKVFDIFEINKTSVDLITTSEVTISLTIDDDKYLDNIIESLEEFSEVEVSRDNAIICAVGDGIYQNSGLALRFFNAMKNINILMISVGASKINFSIVVKNNDLNNSIKSLHSEFFDNLENNGVFYE